MPLTLQEFSSVAPFYKDRVGKINEIKNVKITDVGLENKFPLIRTSCGSQPYSQNFLFEGVLNHDETSVKVNCSCPSFKFEFAHVLNKKKALYNPGDVYKVSILKIPKEKNQKQVVMACKHVIAASRTILKQLDKIQHSIEKQQKKE